MHLYISLFNRVTSPSTTASISFIKGSFRKIFGKYLFVTNTITCGTLMAIGDVIQQEIETFRNQHPKDKCYNNSRYDWKRIDRMFWVGIAIGPPQHVFYKLLDQFLPKRNFQSIWKKILLDQLIASPMCVSIFFFGMGYLEGRHIDAIISEFKSKFITVYTVDWLVWPPTQFINFYFLSPKYRVLYINLMTMLYDVFLSYVKHDIECYASCPLLEYKDRFL